MSWVSPQDILDRWVGAGAPDDLDLVQALIEDAEAVVLAEYPRIQDRITADTLPLGTVVMVVSRMVMRVLRNPEGLSYWQMNTGPFGQGKNYGSNGGVDIWMTADENKLLAPKRKGKAFEIDLAPTALPGVAISAYAGDVFTPGGNMTSPYYVTDNED
jgi:hypothetical protein